MDKFEENGYWNLSYIASMRRKVYIRCLLNKDLLTINCSSTYIGVQSHWLRETGISIETGKGC